MTASAFPMDLPWLRADELGPLVERLGGARAPGKHRVKWDAARAALESAGARFPARARVFSFLMCKGGVGKTSCAFYLARRMAACGLRVLAIDADPQGNLTAAFEPDRVGIEIGEATPVLADVVSGQRALADITLKLAPALHLVPSTPVNSTLDSRIRDRFRNPTVPLRQAIATVAASYELVVIDCAPALNLSNTAVVAATDRLVLPVVPDRFSLMGLEQTLREVETIERDFGIQPGSIERHVLFNRFDGRESTSARYLEEVNARHGPLLLGSLIRASSDLKNAIARREELFTVTGSTAREDLDAVARDLLVYLLGRQPEAVAEKAPSPRTRPEARQGWEV